MSTPEWDIFKRIEDLEGIALELMDKSVSDDPTVQDAIKIAADARNMTLLSYAIWFFDKAQQEPNQARMLKDIFEEAFSKVLSEDALKAMKAMMEMILWVVEKSEEAEE